MGIEVRRADATHVAAIRSVLTRCLADDPLMRWFFPRDREPEDRRLSRIAMYLGPQIEWLVGEF